MRDKQAVPVILGDIGESNSDSSQSAIHKQGTTGVSSFGGAVNPQQWPFPPANGYCALHARLPFAVGGVSVAHNLNLFSLPGYVGLLWQESDGFASVPTADLHHRQVELMVYGDYTPPRGGNSFIEPDDDLA